MEIEGTYLFDAPRQAVWQALLDPQVLARTMPGCERLEQVGENEYKGRLMIRVGPVQGQFEGLVTLADLDPPNGYRMRVSGQGAPGFVKGEGQVRLEDQGPSTLMHYTGTVQVGGRIAGVSQRLLDTTAKALTQQSLGGLAKQIRTGSREEEALTQVETAGTPSQVEFAAGMARHMLNDLVPPERRSGLLAGGLGLLAAVFLLRMVESWWTERLAGRIAEKLKER